MKLGDWAPAPWKCPDCGEVVKGPNEAELAQMVATHVCAPAPEPVFDNDGARPKGKKRKA